MTKYNKPTKSTTRTVNLAGGEAYKPSDKVELLLRTMSFLMSGDAYYSKEKDTTQRIQELVKIVSAKDKEYVLRLAAYARNEMHLRTVPMYLLVEYAKQGIKLPNAYMWVPHILKRADEPAEALAYWMQSTEHKPPAMLKKGIGLAMNYFDEYQFAKYSRKTTVTMKDVLFLCHPKPVTPEQQVLFDKIVSDTLETPKTWEVELSTKGASKETWENIIPHMGFMAVLRNLRNFVQHKVDLDPVIKKLTNEGAVLNSKQFPYRFFSAYRELSVGDASDAYLAYDKYIYPGKTTTTTPSDLLDAVNIAMELSVKNAPQIPGATFVASDNSNSMTSAGPSSKSKVRNIDIASLFSAISLHVCQKSTVGVFGEDYATVPLSKKSTILDNMEKIRNKDVGHATHAYLALKWLCAQGEKVDRIFIFSDMQCYNTRGGVGSRDDLNFWINKYRKDINPECRLYSFDVSSYGLLKFPEGDPLTCPIAGYSDAIFKFIPMFEESRETMLKTIEQYSPI